MNAAAKGKHKLLVRVGRNTRAVRIKLRLSVRCVSTRQVIHWRHWQKIEAGETNLTLKTLDRVADALGVDPAELLYESFSVPGRSATQGKTENDLGQDRQTTGIDHNTAPDIKIAEIIDGTLHENPFFGPKFAHVHSVLIAILVSAFGMGEEGLGGWQILSRPELRFPVPLPGDEDILVPEIAGWRLKRLPELPDTPYLTLAPDWACEVVSAPTARIDRVEKLRIYAREGVQYVWLVDPTFHVLEVFTLGEAQHWTRAAAYADLNHARAAPFEAIELNLSKLWMK